MEREVTVKVGVETKGISGLDTIAMKAEQVKVKTETATKTVEAFARAQENLARAAKAGFGQAVQGVERLARGVALLSVGNKTLEEMGKQLARVQGFVDVTRGALDFAFALQDVAKAWRQVRAAESGAGGGLRETLISGTAEGTAGAVAARALTRNVAGHVAGGAAAGATAAAVTQPGLLARGASAVGRFGGRVVASPGGRAGAVGLTAVAGYELGSAIADPLWNYVGEQQAANSPEGQAANAAVGGRQAMLRFRAAQEGLAQQRIAQTAPTMDRVAGLRRQQFALGLEGTTASRIQAQVRGGTERPMAEANIGVANAQAMQARIDDELLMKQKELARLRRKAPDELSQQLEVMRQIENLTNDRLAAEQNVLNAQKQQSAVAQERMRKEIAFAGQTRAKFGSESERERERAKAGQISIGAMDPSQRLETLRAAQALARGQDVRPEGIAALQGTGLFTKQIEDYQLRQFQKTDVGKELFRLSGQQERVNRAEGAASNAFNIQVALQEKLDVKVDATESLAGKVATQAIPLLEKMARQAVEQMNIVEKLRNAQANLIAVGS